MAEVNIDGQLAEIYDKWVPVLTQEERAAVTGYVQAWQNQIPKLGPVGAKALFIRLFWHVNKPRLRANDKDRDRETVLIYAPFFAGFRGTVMTDKGLVQVRFVGTPFYKSPPVVNE